MLPRLDANNIFLGNDSFHLNSTALTVQDAASPLGANLFEVASNGGITKYFTVSAAGAKVNGNDVCTTGRQLCRRCRDRRQRHGRNHSRVHWQRFELSAIRF
jgi:hypothetical protein